MTRRVDLFNGLQGILTCYKPPEIDTHEFIYRIKKKLAFEFNKLPWESQRIRTCINHNSENNVPSISQSPDFIDNPLVIGKRFQHSDFVINPLDPLPYFASGLQVIGIGERGAFSYIDHLYKLTLVKTYHITGMFGRVSSDGLSTGTTIHKTPWRHISQTKLDRVLANLEFRSRSSALLQSGLRPNTQKTYLALSHGQQAISSRHIIDPVEHLPPEQIVPYWDRKEEPGTPAILRPPPDPSSIPQLSPLINGIRCVKFEPPFFVMELQVVHDTLRFLVDLVSLIGVLLRSSSLLSKLRRSRHGAYEASDSLLLKQFTLSPHLSQQNTFSNLARATGLYEWPNSTE